MERTCLYKNSSDRTSALIDSRLDNNALCKSVGVSLKFKDICREVDHFKQFVYTLARFCRYGNADNIAAPLFAYKTVLGKLLLYLIGVSRRFIHLVYCNDDRKICRFCVVDCFNRLRHDTVISRNNEYCNICSKRTSCTHSGKRFVSGCIKECDIPAACLYSVSTDVLCDTACLACGNVCVSYSVKKRCFTMVNMSHNNNDR